MTLVLNIPWPPSVNSYYRTVQGRTLLSKRGRLYKESVLRAVLTQRGQIRTTQRLEVDIMLHPPDRRRRDLDNLCKAIQDAMQNAGVFIDDSQIDKLALTRSTIEKGGLAIVTVKEI